VENFTAFLFNSFDLNLGKFSIPVPYWEAISIVVLLFFLVIALAQMRKHYVDWSLKGGVVGIFFGFLLALILEGFLLIGGRTVVTQLLGWRNAPPPIAQALDAGRNKLIQVLGAQTSVPSSFAKESPTLQETIQTVQDLPPAELKKIKNILCTP
jgi:hypothetical protein